MKMPFQTVLSGVSQPWGVSLPSHAVVGCAQEQLCRSRRARPQSGAGSSVPRVSGSRWCLWSGTDGDSSERSGSEGAISFPANLRIPRCRQVVWEEGCRLQRAGLRGSMPGRELGLSSQPVRPRCALSHRTPRTGTWSSRARAALGAALHPLSDPVLFLQPGTAGGKPRVRHRPHHGGGRVSPSLPPHPPHPVPHCRWVQLGIEIPDWLLINAAPLIALTQLCSVSLPQSHRPGLGLGMMETGGALEVLLIKKK